MASFTAERTSRTVHRITPPPVPPIELSADLAEALMASRERFRAFMDNCPAVAVIKDPAGRFVYVNSCWLKQFSPEPVDWLGKTDYDFWPKETAELFRDSDRECLARDESVEWEETAITATRGEVTWWVKKFPLVEGGERFVGCIAWDVTERYREEGTVQLLHRAIDSVPHGILIADATLPDLPLIFASSAVEAMTGYASAELIGTNCRFLQGPLSDRDAVERIRRGIRDRVPVSAELINYRKDGSTFINALTISPVYTAGHLTHFVGISTDVTERRRLEEQYRQAQKMEAVGLLAGGISHDFNNLLTVILGYCDLVIEALPDGRSREQVREIRSAGKRAAALTRQLLAFSRKTELEPRVLDVNALVDNMGNLLRRLIGDDIEFVTDLDPILGRVKVDPSQLEQAVMNLCVNARDAMPEGGRLIVATRNTETDVTIAIRDTGKGMTPEVKARAFEPFFTTKGPNQGTGLGLALVFGFAQQSGGRVELHSEPGRGTEFRIHLPRIADDLSNLSLNGEADIIPAGGGTILLVEDELHVRELARQVLESCGYRVIAAADGQDAIVAAMSHPGPIHLALTGIKLPNGMTGPRLMEILGGKFPALPVVFVTESNEVGQGFESLLKPYTPTVLAKKVRALLDAAALTPAGGTACGSP